MKSYTSKAKFIYLFSKAKLVTAQDYLQKAGTVSMEYLGIFKNKLATTVVDTVYAAESITKTVMPGNPVTREYEVCLNQQIRSSINDRILNNSSNQGHKTHRQCRSRFTLENVRRLQKVYQARSDGLCSTKEKLR